MKLKVFIFFAMMVAFATTCFAADHCNGIESGVVYYNEGDFDRAIDEWRTCVDNGVENSDLYYNLGNAYFREGKLGFAIYYYKSALRLDPSNDDIIHNLKYAQAMTRDKVEEDGELLLKRRLAVAYLVGVKLLPPEFVFAGRDDQFFKEHAIEGADIEGFWVDYVQHHGRVKWTRWVLELPEGEHFDPGKLEIPVFTGYTVEEPDPDLDAEFFCDPKRIRYDGKHPDAESMQFRSDPKFDEDVLTGVEL